MSNSSKAQQANAARCSVAHCGLSYARIPADRRCHACGGIVRPNPKLQDARMRFETWAKSEGLSITRGKLGGYAYADTAAAWRAWQALTSQRSQEQPPVQWWNGCDKTVPAALRFLANHERPCGGESLYNSLHLMQLADEIERMTSRPLFAAPPAAVDLGAVAVLVDHAAGKLDHLNNGLCPDQVEGPATRDPDCAVCCALEQIPMEPSHG
ncbi:hypothetical protein [Stenotrophomonas maltophilia]|uniref:hypothetical protein n=1 Tax=Stenotrophomonas maltophilia TaxID=40324 RepID=UPI0013DB925B|nr:hypothetical protein [Stenotrophomonas maltophilia]